MDCGNLKRVTIFAGHYGSGKTNVAVNYALGIEKNRKNVRHFLDKFERMLYFMFETSVRISNGC